MGRLAALGRITLTPLPPHRRRYLTWEGRLDPGPDGSPRGSVTRHATATVAPLIWSPHRLLLDLHTPHQTLRIDLTLPPGPPGSPGEPRAWATVTDLDSRAARGSGTGT